MIDVTERRTGLPPVPDRLADDTDDLDWNVERDGRMRDHATVTEDAEPTTIPWEG